MLSQFGKQVKEVDLSHSKAARSTPAHYGKGTRSSCLERAYQIDQGALWLTETTLKTISGRVDHALRRHAGTRTSFRSSDATAT